MQRSPEPAEDLSATLKPKFINTAAIAELWDIYGPGAGDHIARQLVDINVCLVFFFSRYQPESSAELYKHTQLLQTLWNLFQAIEKT